MGKEAAKDLIKQGHIVYTAARRLEQMKDLEALGGFPISCLLYTSPSPRD